MNSGLKNKLKGSLSLAHKLVIKRLFVGSVRGIVRVAAYGYRLIEGARDRAIEHGLDWQRAWDLKAKPLPPSVPPFGVHDLLFLRDLFSNDNTPPADVLQIRTSVVIPVFNNADFTFQCLRSLLSEIDLRSTEIIVVNDCSTDETHALLSLFRNKVRVVNNEKNSGFGETCNHGASVARGRYLVFLNNDTWVLRGWLDELEKTIEGNDSIGAVGSMFLYPDGRVQEAGGIVWRSGEAFHYGWCRSPDDHRLNFAREVDYCSAASLLIRRDLFEQIGGFDQRYSPAYYEDTDLCMEVRKSGHKVIYQPASRLIHYEGITAGTDVRFGLKRYQVTNHAKFLGKWRSVLETDHLPEDRSNAAQAADRRTISVLIIDDRVPTPDRDAGSSRMFLILKSLAAWCRPVFVSLSKERLIGYEKDLWKLGVETTSAAEYLRLIAEGDFAAAIISRPDVAEAVMPVLRRRAPRLKIIFDLVDVHFIRLQREVEFSSDPHTESEAVHYKRIETRLAREADLIWCNSVEDERVMRDLAPKTPSVVIPTIHSLSFDDKPFEERKGLFFLGNMNHRPNADSLKYLMAKIMPLVWRELPHVELYVVGAAMTPEASAYAGERVHVLGHVPDIRPLFSGSRLMVAPLRFGAGVKGKIGEALASGLPIVTTSIGAESIGIRNEIEGMIADTPQELAAAIVRVYTDRELWQRLADNGMRLIESNFTPDVVGDYINRSIRRLGVEQP
jgi:GT2 family glycosyltransferase